jgi:hypothetical protein
MAARKACDLEHVADSCLYCLAELTGKTLADYGIVPATPTSPELNMKAVNYCRPCQQKKGAF